MPYVPLTRFLFRAPLLPVRALVDAKGPAYKLSDSPLHQAALGLASPDLAEAFAQGRADARANLAVGRYARRAAFRTTPNGFWAGVGVGYLAARGRIDTGTPVGRLSVSWQRLAGLGRALLDDPEVRARVCLRHAPSLVVGAHALVWLGGGAESSDAQGFCEERAVDRDDVLSAVVHACATWTPWPAVRAIVAVSMQVDEVDSADELDDWLLTLLDDGLLQVDLVPPLVGPDPCDWMEARLARVPEARASAEAFARARAAARDGNGTNLAELAAALVTLPGQPTEGPKTNAGSAAIKDLRGTLVFPGQGSAKRSRASRERWASSVTLSRAVVERAAALAPLLFRLQEALVPPSAERTPPAALGELLEATTEIFGAGALDLGALALGDYGASPVGDEGADAAPTSSPALPPAALMTLLLDGITETLCHRRSELSLRSEDLAPLLDELGEAAPPPTCELFLTPRRARPGLRPGDGWLLGLHAPAGASWGRFAAALGDDARQMFEDLRQAETYARPDERALDVVFAPSPRLADLCTHPPLRTHALALSGWPVDDQPAVTLAQLQLVVDPSALEPLALRAPGLDAVAPSPLHRVRSTTAPAGIWQLLVGWSLRRQHAPWALAWGALGQLASLPRVSLDGFVIAPASWRIPEPLRNGAASSRALAAWRRDGRIPRFVQVGSEDELLPIDLNAPGASVELKGHARAFEIWPPLADTPDGSGRRVEAVIGVVNLPDDDERAFLGAAVAATATALGVPPPELAAGAGKDWHTFKLFGATDRQDLILVDVVAPVVEEARATGEISGWFFQRYLEGPGRRPHLRLRVAHDTQRKGNAKPKRTDTAATFRRRLDARIAATLAPGDLVGIDTAPYFPEAARFGGAAALPGVHALFEAGSQLVVAHLARELGTSDDTGDRDASELDTRLLTLIAAYDALAAAFGLDARARRALAERRRAAYAVDLDQDFERALAREFRVYRPTLRAQLPGSASVDSQRAPLRAYVAATHAAAALLDQAARTRILPSLLHLEAVRLAGPDRATEIRALTFWERTLESLERHPERAR